MNHLPTLVATTGTAAALLSGCAIGAIRRPLHAVLWELCVLEHRARFWERTCWLALVLGIALAGSLALPLAAQSTLLTAALSLVLRGETGGAVIGVVVIGLVVLKEARRFRLQGPPPCATPICP
jgi:hypothetical protein